jgi:DNA protecting protein DprA
MRVEAAWAAAPVMLPGMGTGWDVAERAALVALLRERPPLPHGDAVSTTSRSTWAQVTAEVDARGSALVLWHELHPPGLFDGDDDVSLDQAATDIAAWDEADLGFLTFRDEQYPAQLREIHEMPPVLFHRGTLVPDEAGVSVVGSRAASDKGMAIARVVAQGLVERGLTTIAGLAKGIDTAAHEAAMAAGGRTVAVIGTGINHSYPAENRDLQRRIAAEGLVISQFWPDAPPTRQTFPMRNAVMSGYGRATVVVQAGEQSGARIQARQAVAHGRPVILTEMVVAANDWPKTLLDCPGVHVASGAEEILKLVDHILATAIEVDELFAAATGG